MGKEGCGTERKVHIETDGFKAKIVVNGTDISDLVSGYTVYHGAGNVPEIHITVPMLELDFQTDMMPVLPEPWCYWYEPKHYDGSSGNSNGALQD